uniref:RNA-dependent RNA polymerase n=1 Tax=Nackenback virus TaxID=2651951 RepID=A0A5Q0TW80_9VIRU|nr:RNA-dependent RNA polymerase [Nackenback virus]
MARVFDVPRYTNQSLRSLRAYASLSADDLNPRLAQKLRIPNSGQACMSLYSGFVFDLRYIYELTGEDIPEELKQDEFTYALINGKSPTMTNTVSDCLCSFLNVHCEDVTRVIHDSDAIYRICFNIWTGAWNNQSKRHINWFQASKAASGMAMLGAVSDKINSVGAIKYHGGESLFKRAYDHDENLGKAFVCSEAFRLAFDSKVGRIHIKNVCDNLEDLDVSKFEITYGHLKESFPSKRFFRIFNLAFIVDGQTLYILDNSSLNEIHDTLRTPFGFLSYAIGYQPAVHRRNKKAIEFFTKCHNYTIRAMKARFDNNRRCDSLAKQMKESYAVLLAKVGSKEAEGLNQVSQIKASANQTCEGEDPFYEILLEGDPTIAVDIGTYWNVLPAPDADPELMNDRLKRVMNCKRTCDELFWKRFMDYSKSVLTAHIICKKKDSFELRDWEFPDEIDDPRDLPWVINCARGVLDYPPVGQRGNVYVKGVLEWHRKLENWHFAAQDVTHVFADLSKYETVRTIQTMSRSDGSELSYAMTRGPYLSDKYKPSDVREGMEKGKLPGDRVLVLAAKRENTKFGEKVRETASGDDVLREALSELDYNAQQVAASVHGVALRMGRMGFEKRMERMKTKAENGQAYISLDVSGWSPNMNRKNQMEFIDMLMSFYNIPEAMRVSGWFKDIHVVNSRRGYHNVWDMLDGSVQGFFGGCDSIMHNMLAQFCKVVAVESGIIPDDSKVDFMTLIDDLAIKIIGCKEDVIPVLKSFEDTYRKLGFETDLVKTLVSSDHFHFLNRLFGHKGEVVTAAKIFAKSGREYNKRFSSVWSHIDSSLGSVLGSVDRGCSVITGYEWAIMHATKAAVDSNVKVLNDGWSLTHFGAWLPRVFGGWGLPGVISWTTQEGVDPIPDGICRIQRITERMSESLDKQAINEYLSIAVSQKLVKRGKLQAITNPFGIAVLNIPDPDAPGRYVMKKGALRMVKSPDFARLLGTKSSLESEQIIDELTKNCTYPMEIWAAFADTLPMAILEKIISRAEQNEIVVMCVKAEVRHKAINEMRRLNERAARHYKTIIFGEIDNSLAKLRGSSLVAELRKRQLKLDGINATDLHTSPSLEVIANTYESSEGCIRAIQPKLNVSEIYGGREAWSLHRTYRSTSAIVDQSNSLKMHDPVARSIFSLSIVIAAVKAIGGNGSDLLEAYGAIWFGDPHAVILPNIAVTATDPRRICSRTANLSHSVMAYPNFSGSIKVNASNMINRYENTKRTFDWLSVVTAIRAVVATDTEYRTDGVKSVNGLVKNELVYNFNMSGHTGFFRDDSPPIEYKSKAFIQLCNEAKGILDNRTKTYVLGLIGVIPKKVQGFGADSCEYRDIVKSFGYTPPVTSISYSAYEILAKRGIEKTMLTIVETTPFSPLCNIDKSILKLDKVVESNVDIITPTITRRSLTSRVVTDVTTGRSDKRISQSLIVFAQRVTNHPKITDNFWVKAHNDMKNDIMKEDNWTAIFEKWGNKHFVPLIADSSVENSKALLKQIEVDLDHPPTIGFTKSGNIRAQELLNYATRYHEESENMSKPARVRYKKRFECVAMQRLASCAIVGSDAVTSIIDVGEAINRDIVKIFEREFKVTVPVVPSVRSIKWLSNQGVWAKDYKDALNEIIPSTFKAKADIITGLMWALNNIEQWIESDILKPEGRAEYAKNIMQTRIETKVVDKLEEFGDFEFEIGELNMGGIVEAEEEKNEVFSDDDMIKVCDIDFNSDEWRAFTWSRGIFDKKDDELNELVYLDFINEQNKRKKRGKQGVSDVV